MADCRSRIAWMALCVRVFCVVFIYLAHTVLNGGFHACGFDASSEDGLGSAAEAEESGSFACGEAFFDADAILPRSQENDPFLAYLKLAALMLPPRHVEASENVRGAQPRSADRRPPDALHPHLRLLAHASHILC
jgi:hypothetical protein